MSAQRTTEASDGLRFRTVEALEAHMGRRLKELRKRRGMQQPKLAAASGVGLRQIQHLEGATSGGSLDVWLRLTLALDVELEELFRPAEPPVTGAREKRARYKLHRRATPAQVETLASIAKKLDEEAAESLIELARRVLR